MYATLYLCVCVIFFLKICALPVKVLKESTKAAYAYLTASCKMWRSNTVAAACFSLSCFHRAYGRRRSPYRVPRSRCDPSGMHIGRHRSSVAFSVLHVLAREKAGGRAGSHKGAWSRIRSTRSTCSMQKHTDTQKKKPNW